jgi:protein TonB
MTSSYKEKRIRLLLFLVTGILHGALLFFVVFPAASSISVEEESKAIIIRVMDIQEEIRPPPPPPPVQRDPPPEITSNTIEAVAETIIETEEVPEEIVYSGVIVPVHEAAQEEAVEYLAMGRVSVLPQLPEDQIRRAIVYPPIAQRSGIEGIVYLELFVDAQGNIRNITILRETPENRGFGDAAVNALRGITAVPGEADGQKVGVRFRYPIRFTLR